MSLFIVKQLPEGEDLDYLEVAVGGNLELENIEY